MTHRQPPASVETLKAIAAAFNAHDLDAIMAFFADDCSLDMPRGREPWGQRFTGKAAVREALAGRFKGLPDVHYGEDRHWVAGDRGVSEDRHDARRTQGAGPRLRPLGVSRRQGDEEGLLLEDCRGAGLKRRGPGAAGFEHP